MSEFDPGDRFFDRERWEQREPEGPHIWRTLGYERAVWEPGRQVIEWKAGEEYAFPSNSGYIVHGGMVATILDSAMGGACWLGLGSCRPPHPTLSPDPGGATVVDVKRSATSRVLWAMVERK